MLKLCLLLMITFALAQGYAVAAPSQNGCTSTWGRGKLKSYKQIEHEIHGKHMGVKILRVVLCGEPKQQYFQVTVLDTKGTVRTMQLPAR